MLSIKKLLRYWNKVGDLNPSCLSVKLLKFTEQTNFFTKTVNFLQQLKSIGISSLKQICSIVLRVFDKILDDSITYDVLCVVFKGTEDTVTTRKTKGKW